jgi:hypothetical protein
VIVILAITLDLFKLSAGLRIGTYFYAASDFEKIWLSIKKNPILISRLIMVLSTKSGFYIKILSQFIGSLWCFPKTVNIVFDTINV